MKKIKTVIVLGKGSLAINIAKWFKESPDYNIICIVPVIPEPTRTFKVQVDNPIDAKVKLKARKTLDGNILNVGFFRLGLIFYLL